MMTNGLLFPLGLGVLGFGGYQYMAVGLTDNVKFLLAVGCLAIAATFLRMLSGGR